jgi:hypothetical protein
MQALDRHPAQVGEGPIGRRTVDFAYLEEGDLDRWLARIPMRSHPEDVTDRRFYAKLLPQLAHERPMRILTRFHLSSREFPLKGMTRGSTTLANKDSAVDEEKPRHDREWPIVAA